ncbi:MAG TPA: multiheme c-type cytochrome [Pyrinomonadaceae bacterium]
MNSRSRDIKALLLMILAIAACVGFVVRAQGPAMSGAGLASSTWRPAGTGVKYVGPQACVKCHEEESANQKTTAMGRAVQTAASSEVLKSNPKLTFRSGPYSYEIARRGQESIYTVSDGTSTISEPIAYSFGQGKAGQTYVFRHNGSFYESRVSFYRDIKGLDWTMGYPSTVPPSLDVAAGRQMSSDETRDCFSCHSTVATAGSQVALDRMLPGVTCEACHGPGGDHVVAMQTKQLADKKIFNPGKMSPDDQSQEFCGSCHRSAEQVMSIRILRGIITVRFQPYRIFTSKGHDPADPRMTCIACHNPHEDPHENQAYYDERCFACHRSADSLKSEKIANRETAEGRTATACSVAARECTTCHMPKVEIPGSHFQFTDHRIRIARPGEAFPN